MPHRDVSSSPTSQTALIVRMLEERDIAVLDSVLREHVRDLHTGVVVDGEVAAIQSYMKGEADSAGRTRRYRVVCDGDDNAIACMALSAPDALMSQHFDAEASTAVELLNAFVAKSWMRGKGVGRLLFDAMCLLGKEENAHWLLVNSGPRYRASWPFYDRVCDSSHGFIDDYYGVGRHAKTWKKRLR